MDILKLEMDEQLYLSKLADIDDFAQFAVYLESLLNGPKGVSEHGGQIYFQEEAARVAEVRGMKIEIYPKEHAPPHFHVRSTNVDVSIQIGDCSVLAGKISKKDLKKIQYWCKYAKQQLVEKWDAMRPTECTVGPYKE